jgi:hypothetical protein
MARTTFSGPVASTAGFEGTIDTAGEALVLATPTAYGEGESLTADAYITFTGQDGSTYYIPVSTSAPA